MLGYMFAQSALLHALLLIMNIYSVYSKYFGFNFIQGYMNKFVFRSVRKSKVPLTISQISFVEGHRMVITSCQNSWTHFRFY